MSVDEFPWLDNSNSFLVHVEHWLGQQVGEDIAGFLQTGRSRNDQDAAAERLFQRELILTLADVLSPLLTKIIQQAENHADTLMPGYTHLQHAQPWTFGHYLLRHASILARDLERLRDVFPRVNLSALGGAANAGTSWPIDRRRTAELLGHGGIVVNYAMQASSPATTSKRSLPRWQSYGQSRSLRNRSVSLELVRVRLRRD